MILVSVMFANTVYLHLNGLRGNAVEVLSESIVFF